MGLPPYLTTDRALPGTAVYCLGVAVLALPYIAVPLAVHCVSSSSQRQALPCDTVCCLAASYDTLHRMAVLPLTAMPVQLTCRAPPSSPCPISGQGQLTLPLPAPGQRPQLRGEDRRAENGAQETGGRHRGRAGGTRTRTRREEAEKKRGEFRRSSGTRDGTGR